MAATSIPYAWIATPVLRRPTAALNNVSVTQTDGASATSTNAASVTRYGQSQASVTLDTACDADPGNLATFITTYQSTPRPRQPLVAFQLIGRSDAEALIILTVKLGTRVQITGAPAAWPPGAANFVVEGIHHLMGVEDPRVEWSTAALIGSSPTAPGPWFTLGTSLLDGTDVVPF